MGSSRPASSRSVHISATDRIIMTAVHPVRRAAPPGGPRVTKRRRGQGEGSIYRRPVAARSPCRVSAGATAGRGAPVLPRPRPEGGWRESWLGRSRRLPQGCQLAVERLTVKRYFLGRWLEAKQGAVRPGAWTRYEELVQLHGDPKIGRRRLARLKPGAAAGGLHRAPIEPRFRDPARGPPDAAQRLEAGRPLECAMAQNITRLMICPSPQNSATSSTPARLCTARSYLKAAQAAPAGSALSMC